MESLKLLVLSLQNTLSTINVGKSNRVAKTKHVEAPTFKGDRALYTSWKETIKAYLTSTETQETFRGHFIF